MKLLVIENGNYCQDNFENFINDLVDLKDIVEVVYVYDAKNKPENVISELHKGVDFITLCPHVINAEQWENIIDYLARYKVEKLKEIHIYYPLDGFEKDLMNSINYKFVDKIVEIKKRGIGLFISKIYEDEIFCLRKVNIEVLKDRNLTLRASF
jgi:hypothetical protein